MKYQLRHNLGLVDAKYLNDHYGTSLAVKPDELKAGKVIDLTDRAVDYLVNIKKCCDLLDTPQKITGEAKKPELTAPAK